MDYNRFGASFKDFNSNPLNSLAVSCFLVAPLLVTCYCVTLFSWTESSGSNKWVTNRLLGARSIKRFHV